MDIHATSQKYSDQKRITTITLYGSDADVIQLIDQLEAANLEGPANDLRTALCHSTGLVAASEQEWQDHVAAGLPEKVADRKSADQWIADQIAGLAETELLRRVKAKLDEIRPVVDPRIEIAALVLEAWITASSSQRQLVRSANPELGLALSRLEVGEI